MAKNNDYWIKREQAKLLNQDKDINKLLNDLKSSYKKAMKDIDKEIGSLFSRYANKNELSYHEAAKLLTNNQYKTWRMDLKDYMKAIEKTGDIKLKLELETLAMKSRITRLQEIQYQCDKILDNLYYNYHEDLTRSLKASIEDSYYRTIFDVQQYTGQGFTFSKINQKLVNDILTYPWSGKAYSSRIWANRDKLKDVIKEEMTNMIIRGKGSRDIAKSIAKKMDTSYSNSIKLVQSEHSYVTNSADKESYNEMGLEEYQFLATLDNRTSTTCQGLDLEVFKLKEAKVGINYPPMHVSCRSTTIPYIPDDDFGTRFARDSRKSIEVPGNMKYEQWKQLYGVD